MSSSTVAMYCVSENASTKTSRKSLDEFRALCLCIICVVLTPSALFAQGFDFIGGDGFEDGCSLDSDNDRLPDCVETGTRIFRGPRNTGTSATNPDTDADGLSDGDEVLGTVAGLDLPSLGAKALRKTILIEYDWFDDALDCGAHSHRPTRQVINGTAASFAAAPVTNPDGSTGIDLIQDYGQGGLFTGGNLVIDENGVLADGLNLDSEFYQHKSQNFSPLRQNYFHYTLIVHRYSYSTNDSSGLAEFNGDDFIISLACYGVTENVRNTIVHELGHNLGLQHGGDESCNYKPNYNSIMNYRYQFSGIDSNCSIAGDGLVGYSIGSRPVLNETELNENAGICGLAASVPTDWNANTALENNVSVDINGSDPNQNAACKGALSPLHDFDDYTNLNLAAIRFAQMRSNIDREVIDCQPLPDSAKRMPNTANP